MNLNLHQLSFAALAIAVLGASGLYLLLPHAHGKLKPRSAHLAGAGLSSLAVLFLLGRLSPPGPWLSSLFFYGFSALAIASAILMITSRDPVYGALWFASVVLATAGLFLLAEAQFLAAGTVIVYAGAIIVTFLFVIMLAQAEGRAPYDRSARTPFRSTLICFLLLFGLLHALTALHSPIVDAETGAVEPADPLSRPLLALKNDPVVAAASPSTARLPVLDPTDGKTPPAHVAALGATLFADHLISVEVAGVILFVALVGALAIATPRRPVRPGDRSSASRPDPSTDRTT